MSKKGFTLVELLVVIAIIAVLAAILFPVFISVKARAYETACASNMSQIYKGICTYMQDNDDKFPWATDYFVWDSGAVTLNLRDLLGVGGPRNVTCSKYIKNSNLFMCPADIGIGTGASKQNSFYSLYGCSYGYRGFHSLYWDPEEPRLPPDGYPITWLAGRRVGDFRRPSKTTCINDAWVWHRAATDQYFVNNPSKQKNLLNVVYVDGHAKSLFYNDFVAALYIIK